MEQSTKFLYLSDEILETLGVSTAEAVESIEELLRARARAEAWDTPVNLLMVPDGRIMLAAMAVADDPPLLAVKSQTFNPRNADRGLAPANGVVSVLSSETGLPAAVLDVGWITRVRTAGLSVVAAKRLARPDSSIIAFIGCGAQARTHLQAIGDMFPIREIRAFGRGSKNRDALCAAARSRGYAAVASASGREAIEGADIVVTSVTFDAGLRPFLDARSLKPGAFATVTDLAVPWMKEGMAAFDHIIVDDLEQEAGARFKMLDPALIGGDLSGLVAGDTPGRDGDRQRTAFVFRGLALGDLALAGVAYRKALATSRGLAIG